MNNELLKKHILRPWLLGSVSYVSFLLFISLKRLESNHLIINLNFTLLIDQGSQKGWWQFAVHDNCGLLIKFENVAGIRVRWPSWGWGPSQPGLAVFLHLPRCGPLFFCLRWGGMGPSLPSPRCISVQPECLYTTFIQSVYSSDLIYLVDSVRS